VGVNASLANFLGSRGKRVAPGKVRGGVVGAVNVVVVQNHALVTSRLGARRRSLGAGRGLGAGLGLAVGRRSVVGSGSGFGFLGGSVGGSLFLDGGLLRGGLRPGGGPRRGPGSLLSGGLLNSAGAGASLGAGLGAVGLGAGLGPGPGLGGPGLGGAGLGGAGLLLPVAPVLARGGVRGGSVGRRRGDVTCSDGHVLGSVNNVGLPDDFALHERHGEGAGGESGNNKSGAHVD